MPRSSQPPSQQPSQQQPRPRPQPQPQPQPPQPPSQRFADSSEDEQEMTLAERRRRIEAAKVEADAEEEDDDPPPTAPLGFQIVDWAVGDTVEHFLWYSGVDKRAPQWHVGRVVKEINTSSRSKFTHDACLDGTEQVRGVTLTAALYDSTEGRFWYKLSPFSA